MLTPEHIQPIIDKYLSGKATKEELAILNEWYRSFNDSEVELEVSESLDEEVLGNRIRQRLLESVHQEQELKIIKPRRRWYIPAAAVLLVLFGATWFLFFNNKKEHPVAKVEAKPALAKNDIAPGGNKAVLILADGSSVILDSTSNGVITKQGSIEVKKLSNGLLAYTVNGKQITENNAAFYNTISTPRGGQYQVTLSDGTLVWLNAASSIRFPVIFSGTERKVEITGEAYFEVAKNAAMPFKVKTFSSEVEVLGTHFNVNAYDDEESVKTTLLEGKVKVSANNQLPRFLQPGQQAGINNQGNIAIINDADVEEVMAWKNGRFQYKSADVKTILRQISRWYDVDVEYRGNVNLHFTGQLPRSVTASKVFEKLEMTGEVHFKIEGKKIIVSP
jgi:transmembrane sensor